MSLFEADVRELALRKKLDSRVVLKHDAARNALKVHAFQNIKTNSHLVLLSLQDT